MVFHAGQGKTEKNLWEHALKFSKGLIANKIKSHK